MAKTSWSESKNKNMISRETDAPTGIHIACQTLIVCITEQTRHKKQQLRQQDKISSKYNAHNNRLRHVCGPRTELLLGTILKNALYCVLIHTYRYFYYAQEKRHKTSSTSCKWYIRTKQFVGFWPGRGRRDREKEVGREGQPMFYLTWCNRAFSPLVCRCSVYKMLVLKKFRQ